MIKLDVEGMHCNACKMLIEDEVSEVEGVDKVKVDVKKGTVAIAGKPDVDKVKRAIVELGYKIR